MNLGDDQQILREVMARELDTINAYQRLLERATQGEVQRFLAHAILEEKEHVAEALQLLRSIDPMQADALDEDHSDHFTAGGPGDQALQRLRASTGSGSAAAGDDPAPLPAPVRPSPREPTAPPAAQGPWIIGPGARLDQPTVGSLRPQPSVPPAGP